MTETLLSEPQGPTTPLQPIGPADLEAWLADRPPMVRALAEAAKFTGKPGQVLALPGAEGGTDRVLIGVGDSAAFDVMSLRALPARLPAGDYVFDDAPAGADPAEVALAWGLGAYRFDRYKKKKGEPAARLVVPDGVDVAEVRTLTHACALAKDMVNTPSNDMGPLQMETIAREIAEQYGARFTAIVGDGLLEANYPAVHAVGRAAEPYRAPRFLEMAWGADSDPVVCIVGKGVVFDTGGLDIKPSAGMRWMKKDMGGGAHALALGRMVMAARLKVRLVVLVPVVENAIAGDAMRPGDILDSRKGLTIEVGNTDAEGRLILADALARAAEHDPVLTIDMATLTGAARAALGPTLVPFYTDDDTLAGEIESAAKSVSDPVWRMPLWDGYEDSLDSDIADLKNDPDGWAQAGSVTAALFLRRFAPTSGSWVHFDIFAWNARTRPGYSSGAEAQVIRALYRVLKARYS